MHSYIGFRVVPTLQSFRDHIDCVSRLISLSSPKFLSGRSWLFHQHVLLTSSVSQAGLAVIAFGTLEKHGVNVPVVPIGLNYFRGHRFRARAVVEYGPPIRISEELYELYK